MKERVQQYWEMRIILFGPDHPISTMTTRFWYQVQYSCSPKHNGRGSPPCRDGCQRWHLILMLVTMTSLSTLTPLGSPESSRDLTGSDNDEGRAGSSADTDEVSTTRRSGAYPVRSRGNADGASGDLSRSIADGADTERSRGNADVASDYHSRPSADVVSQKNEHYLELHAAGMSRDGFEVVAWSN
jgi:hypothetical protein